MKIDFKNIANRSLGAAVGTVATAFIQKQAAGVQAVQPYTQYLPFALLVAGAVLPELVKTGKGVNAKPNVIVESVGDAMLSISVGQLIQQYAPDVMGKVGGYNIYNADNYILGVMPEKKYLGDNINDYIGMLNMADVAIMDENGNMLFVDDQEKTACYQKNTDMPEATVLEDEHTICVP